MNEAVHLVPALAVGVLLGAVFFGGLWWTVRKALSAEHPASWILGSTLLRTGIVLTGFYFISSGDWKRLLACLFGFVIARAGITRLTRPAGSPARPEGTATHAS